jgi:hypothetical protein
MTRKTQADDASGHEITPPGERQEVAVTSLPSPNIIHADVFENQMQNSLHGFASGIVALQGEMEGQQRAFEAAQAELAQKHEAAKADLLRRISDLEKAKRMAEAALDVAGEPKQ